MPTIHKGGREYLTAPVEGAADDVPLEVSLDEQTWVPAERLPGKVRFLAAHPTVTNNPANTVVLKQGPNFPVFRSPGNPEIIIRPANQVDAE